MVFFILDSEVQRGQPFLKELRLEDTPVSAAEDMTAPADIHIGQIVFILPVLGVQHRIHAGAVSTGGITENTESRISPCIVGIYPFVFHDFRVFLHMFSDEIVFIRFILGGCQKDCLVHKLRQLGQGIPEQAADTTGHIDSGPFQFRKRNHFQIRYLKASLLPPGADAQHVEEFRNILAGGAHIGAGPEDHADIFRVFALVGNEFFNHLVPQLHAQLPACR